jgi:hypothetical protein
MFFTTETIHTTVCSLNESRLTFNAKNEPDTVFVVTIRKNNKTSLLNVRVEVISSKHSRQVKMYNWREEHTEAFL